MGLPPVKRHPFGLVRFRSPLLTESLRFPLLPVLRCFSSRAYLLAPYAFRRGSPGMTPAGLPHSDIHGSQPAGGSPWLFAAIHVLLRPSVPRHPPCTLPSSTPRSLATPSRQDLVRSCPPDPRQVRRLLSPCSSSLLCACKCARLITCRRAQSREDSAPDHNWSAHPLGEKTAALA